MTVTVYSWIEMATMGILGSLSILMGMFLMRLRIAAADSPTTQAQRWGMSFLAWLFICNGTSNLISLAFTASGVRSLEIMAAHISLVSPAMAVGFGMVFPKPLFRPASLPRMLLALAVIIAILIALGMGDIYIVDKKDWMYMFVPTVIAWMFIIIRWTRMYVKSGDHPEASMINTALVWAFLFHIIIRYNVWVLLLTMLGAVPGTIYDENMLMVVTAVVAVGLISAELYRRRGKWGPAERTHAVFIAATVLVALIYESLRGPDGVIPRTGVAMFLVGGNTGLLEVMGIDLVRNALLFYALLRYQLFGHELRVEREVSVLATLIMSGFTALFTARALMGYGTGVMTAAVPVTFLALLYPSYLAARWAIGRVIPSARELSRQEARNVYYISFQGASHRGEITEQSDEEALAALRKRLGVSDREHGLLLEQERQRERAGGVRARMKYVMLLDESGRLAAHVGPADEADIDKEILAGMLTAVRSFVSDAFKSGQTPAGELDVLRYGDRTMVMEKGGGYLLAAAIEGEASPAVRTAVGDMLTILLKRHGNILFEWDGNVTDAEPAKLELQRMVDSYNVSGGI